MSQTIIIWYLVLTVPPYSITTIPQPYDSKEECQAAGKVFADQSWTTGYTCIPNKK